MNTQRLRCLSTIVFTTAAVAACSSYRDGDAPAAAGDTSVGGAGTAAGWPQGAGGDQGVGATASSGSGAIECDQPMPYASEVVSFTPGINAGFGEDEPEVVLGPPRDGSPQVGSLHVLSLGVGGEIVVGFGERIIFDGPGADFVVWENPFWIGGNEALPYAEFGEVAVSRDGETWHSYDCVPSKSAPYDEGCAGWRPMRLFDACNMNPIDPQKTGGDAFDLADLGLSEARFIRIRDRATSGAAPSAGFDLDAVGAVHLREP